MTLDLLIIISVIILGFVSLGYFISFQIRRFLDKSGENEDQKVLIEWLKDMRGSLDKNLLGVQDSLNRSSDTLNKRLDTAAQAVLDVQKSLSAMHKEVGIMSEIGRSMKQLEDFLKSPKLRGNIGEHILADLLSQMLPRENFALQFTFRSGKRVDAVLKTDEGLIPVDSKFPFENFNLLSKAESENSRDLYRKIFEKDVKSHIDNIAKNYINPDENTLDFALMYIPSEAIYYEVVVGSENLGKYAWSKRVLPVSPNVFYGYIKAILIGLEGKKVEERAKIILGSIKSLQGDSQKFSETLSKLVRHVTNAKNQADSASSEFNQLKHRIGGLGRISGEFEKKREIPEFKKD